MKAIILAAGQGTRLKKYTENLPKGMLVFAGKTIIERQIETYRKNGIEDIIIVRGYAAEKIDYKNVKYYTNDEFDKTNMVESLLTAKEEFDDDIIVSYSDILFSDDMLKGMMDSDGHFVVAVDQDWQEYWEMRYGRVGFDTESLEIDEGGNIISLGLPDVSPDIIDARYVGILKFSREGLMKILDIMNRDYNEYRSKPWKQSGKTIRQAYMTDLLQALIDEGEPVKAQVFHHGWLEFDTNEDYERACIWESTGEIKKLIELE
jgi:choline kinase